MIVKSEVIKTVINLDMDITVTMTKCWMAKVGRYHYIVTAIDSLMHTVRCVTCATQDIADRCYREASNGI